MRPADRPRSLHLLGVPSEESFTTATLLILLPESALPVTQKRGHGRVEDGRGGLGLWHRSVSRPRSSNRTCGFPASGFPTGFTSRLTAARQGELGAAAARQVPQTPPRPRSGACRATAPCDPEPGSHRPWP